MNQYSHYRDPRRKRVKKKKPKKIFEKIIAEKFHNMGKGTVNQVQEGKEFQTG